MADHLRYLLAIRSFLEGGWCQRTLSLNDGMEECDPMDPSARYFCLGGAIMRCVPNDVRRQVAATIIGDIDDVYDHIIRFNDKAEFKAEVVSLVERAIERERGRLMSASGDD